MTIDAATFPAVVPNYLCKLSFTEECERDLPRSLVRVGRFHGQKCTVRRTNCQSIQVTKVRRSVPYLLTIWTHLYKLMKRRYVGVTDGPRRGLR